jgi:methyltransferase (TIGR00027 family)
MQETAPSRTALTTSLIRAHHARTSLAPLINDPWGDVLVPQSFVDVLLQWASQDDTHSVIAGERQAVLDGYLSRAASYASVIFRSRFAEDALDAAIAKGVRQYVQIGAGFDSYVLRRPPHARDVQVFEVDHPATQTLKLRRLSELAVSPPVRAEFIAADLARESIVDALRRSGFQFDKPAFFSWLGVTMYLTREANLTTLRAIAACCKPESSVVFTYTDELGLLSGSQSAAYERMKRNVAALGEPFLSGFDPQQLSAILAGVGFVLEEDLSGLDLSERYACSTAPPLLPSAFSRIALAVVNPTTVPS